jgi:hypothetical protein
MHIIIISAFSPKWNTIASLRVEKLAKYLSMRTRVTVIAGMPDNIEQSELKEYDIGAAKLIEIPAIRLRNKQTVKTIQNTSRIKKLYNISTPIYERLKYWVSPLLEFYFPVSPGGFVWHNLNAFKKALRKEINQSNNPTIIFSTFGPWFPMKLAYSIKSKLNVYWCADFRDPPYFTTLSPAYKAFFLKTYTKKIIDKSDLITVVNKNMFNSFLSLSKKREKILFLPNGYDPDDFANYIDNYNDSISPSGKLFNIVYTGSLYPSAGRDITPIVKMLCNLKKNYPESFSEVRFHYAGKDWHYVDKVFGKYGLRNILVNHRHIKRKEALSLQKEANLLVLISYSGRDIKKGSGIITGKIYEYINFPTPILAIGDKNGEIRDIILPDGVSKIFLPDEINKGAAYINSLINSNAKFKFNIDNRKRVLARFSYQNLSLDLLNNLELLLNRRGE